MMFAVLKKVGSAKHTWIEGSLHAPMKIGSVLVIEFQDGFHEYVTTPIQSFVKVVGENTYYIKTQNSHYRLEVKEAADTQVSDIWKDEAQSPQ